MRKIFILALALVLPSALLAACASNNTIETSTATVQPAVSQTTMPESATTAELNEEDIVLSSDTTLPSVQILEDIAVLAFQDFRTAMLGSVSETDRTRIEEILDDLDKEAEQRNLANVMALECDDDDAECIVQQIDASLGFCEAYDRTIAVLDTEFPDRETTVYEQIMSSLSCSEETVRYTNALGRIISDDNGIQVCERLGELSDDEGDELSLLEMADLIDECYKPVKEFCDESDRFAQYLDNLPSLFMQNVQSEYDNIDLQESLGADEVIADYCNEAVLDGFKQSAEGLRALAELESLDAGGLPGTNRGNTALEDMIGEEFSQ